MVTRIHAWDGELQFARSPATSGGWGSGRRGGLVAVDTLNNENSNMGELVVGIDVGTTKICTLVGEVRAEDVHIVGVGVEPARGMKKGVVNDVAALTQAISSSVHKAERSSGYEIGRAFVSVAGAHIDSKNSKGVVGISSPRGVQITDLERAMDAARAIALPHNREVLHVIPRSYTLDGQEGVRSPLGMHGFRLEVEAHIVMAATTSLQNLEKCVKGAGVFP